MTEVKVSVVIPSYNHGKFIKTAIESVLNQTYKDFELIIMDDCSTDNSKKIIDSFKDERIRKYFSTKNCGAVETLNKLIDLSQGEFIAILNSDDYWSLDKLEKQVSFLEKNRSIAACFTWADFVDEKGVQIYDKSITPTLFQRENRTQSEWFEFLINYGNCLCHPSILIRKEVYEKLGKYKNGYRQLPDFEMWLRILRNYGNVHILQENLTHFRLLSGEVKNTSHLSSVNDNIMCYESYAIGIEILDCNNKLFYDTFKDKLINKDCLKDDTMIEFEKAMIQYKLKYNTQINRFIAYKKIFDIISNERKKNIIEKEYNFTLQDYFKLAESIVDLNTKIFEPNEKIVTKIPDDILNSRAYKISNKIYKSKLYNRILKIRLAFRKKRNR